MWPRAMNALAASAGTAVLAPWPCGQEPSGFWFFAIQASALSTAASTLAGTFSSSSAARTTALVPPTGISERGEIAANAVAAKAIERNQRRDGDARFMGSAYYRNPRGMFAATGI